MIDRGHFGRQTYKKEMTQTMDAIVMDSIGKGEYSDFKEYKNDMEDFTFASIFGSD